MYFNIIALLKSKLPCTANFNKHSEAF